MAKLAQQCQTCRARVSQHAKWCGACGAPIAATSAPTAPTALAGDDEAIARHKAAQDTKAKIASAVLERHACGGRPPNRLLEQLRAAVAASDEAWEAAKAAYERRNAASASRATTSLSEGDAAWAAWAESHMDDLGWS